LLRRIINILNHKLLRIILATLKKNFAVGESIRLHSTYNFDNSQFQHLLHDLLRVRKYWVKISNAISDPPNGINIDEVNIDQNSIEFVIRSGFRKFSPICMIHLRMICLFWKSIWWMQYSRHYLRHWVCHGLSSLSERNRYLSTPLVVHIIYHKSYSD